MKKISFVGATGAFLLVSLLASAQTAAPATQDASVLAILEGTITFCSKVDPESADKYKDLAKLLTNGQSDEAIDQVRNTKEYKDSLDKISKQLEALSTKEASEACKAQGK